MTDDDLGMVWWNSLTERERSFWLGVAGNSGRAKDAWEAFKSQRDSHSNGERGADD